MSFISVQLKRSLIARSPGQREALRCLGLKKINQTKILPDSPSTRGQIAKVSHLVHWKKESSSVKEKAKKQKPAPKKASAGVKKKAKAGTAVSKPSANKNKKGIKA